MADHIEERRDQLELLRSLPADNSTEKIDALWQQIIAFKFAEGDVAQSRSRRVQAEASREKAEQEAAEATRRLCEGLKVNADKMLGDAEALKIEATQILEEAKAEFARAQKATRNAEAEQDRIIAEAKQKAQEIMDQTRMTAQQEGTDLRRQALKEIKAVLSRIDAIRMATDEELETQRIFTNIAKLKATTLPTMAEVAYETGDGAVAPSSAPGNGASSQVTDADGATKQATVVTAKAPSNGRSEASIDKSAKASSGKGTAKRT